MNTSRLAKLIKNLKDKEYRDAFVSETIRNGIAFQIHSIRGMRGWTQAELGRKAGMAQETISVLENPNYGKPSLTTLKRIASALDVALVVRFVPFSELVDWVTDLSHEDVAVVSFDQDQQIQHQQMPELSKVISWASTARFDTIGINTATNERSIILQFRPRVSEYSMSHSQLVGDSQEYASASTPNILVGVSA